MLIIMIVLLLSVPFFNDFCKYLISSTNVVSLVFTRFDTLSNISSLDFSNFILDTLQKNDYAVVILKLDIEGGEYPVLDALISNNLISRFNTIYVEFHSQYMSSEFASEYRKREKAFLEYAKKAATRVIRRI